MRLSGTLGSICCIMICTKCGPGAIKASSCPVMAIERPFLSRLLSAVVKFRVKGRLEYLVQMSASSATVLLKCVCSIAPLCAENLQRRQVAERSSRSCSIKSGPGPRRGRPIERKVSKRSCESPVPVGSQDQGEDAICSFANCTNLIAIPFGRRPLHHRSVLHPVITYYKIAAAREVAKRLWSSLISSKSNVVDRISFGNSGISKS